MMINIGCNSIMIGNYTWSDSIWFLYYRIELYHRWLL